MQVTTTDFERLCKVCAGNERATKVLQEIVEAERIGAMKFEKVEVTRAIKDNPVVEVCERLDAHWCIASKYNLTGLVRGKYEMLHISTGLGVGSIGKRADIIRMHEEMKKLEGMDWTDAESISKSKAFQEYREIISRYRGR